MYQLRGDSARESPLDPTREGVWCRVWLASPGAAVAAGEAAARARAEDRAGRRRSRAAPRPEGPEGGSGRWPRAVQRVD